MTSVLDGGAARAGETGGDPELERRASPLHLADATAAPPLLLHGADERSRGSATSG